MDNKKIIIIGIIVLIILAGVIIIMLTSVNYEKIEITPNGTTIDVPANQTRFRGEFEGIKLWNWDHGALVTCNSHEGSGIIRLTGISFDSLNDLIKNNGRMENIDGLKCYEINADDLLEVHIFDFIKLNYKGKLYCIPLNNETTYDNIIIFCKEKDVAVHMAQSVEYKKVYSNNTTLDKAIFTVNNITENLQSKANNITNHTNISTIKSAIEDKAGKLLS